MVHSGRDLGLGKEYEVLWVIKHNISVMGLGRVAHCNVAPRVLLENSRSFVRPSIIIAMHPPPAHGSSLPGAAIFSSEVAANFGRRRM